MCPETPDLAPAGAGDGPEVIDLKLVSDIIVQLNIVRKNTRIYPVGHPQLEASMKRVLNLLDQHYAYAQDLSLGVTRDTLLVGERELPRSNPIFAEFAGRLHERSVFSLCLSRGMDKDELLALNQILARETEAAPGETDEEEEKEALKEDKRKLADLDLPHVKIGILDWESYDFSDELEIDLEAQAQEKGKAGTSWEKYVRSLLEKDADEHFTDSEDGIELKNVDSEKLAKFLNQLERKKERDLSYDKVIATYMREASASATSLDTVKDTEVKANFVALVNEMDGGFRKEILSEAYKFSRRAPDVSVRMLDKRPVKAVLSALEEANGPEKHVDAKVFELVDRLATVDDAKAFRKIPDNLDETEAASLRHLALAFFTSRGFPKSHVEEDRAKTLDAVMAELSDADPDKTAGARAKEAEEAIDSLSIGEHAVWALLDLLENAVNRQHAESYAAAIADIMNEYIHLKHFDLVVRIWNELDYIAAASEGSRAGVDEYAYKAQIQFWHPENITLMASAILEHGLNKAEHLTGILVASGHACADQMVEVLGLQESKSLRRVLTRIVLELRAFSLPHIVKRLDDDNWYVVRNMLEVIQEMEDASALEKVHALVEHPEVPVRLEALKTLVLLGHSEANSLLLEHFDDPDEEMAHGAIAIAGSVYDGEIIRGLLAIVTARRLFRKDFDLPRKTEAVRALGRLAPAGVLPELYKVVSTRRMFSKKDFERLNLVIFKNLRKYDLEQAEPLIQWGLACPDIQIINICKSLQDRTTEKRMPKKKEAEAKPAPGVETHGAKPEKPPEAPWWRTVFLPRSAKKEKG